MKTLIDTENNRQETSAPPQVSRSHTLVEKIVIVDGQGGCGKTMLSPIVSALDRVELLAYAYELEYVCALKHLGKITDDTAATMVCLLTDLQLYNSLMGRETNFRFSDLSSVFNNANPWRYFKRIFSKGDEFIPERIAQEKPILQLTTHILMGISEPLFRALGERLVFIDMVRHPLYMIKQLVLLEMDSLLKSGEKVNNFVRNFGLHIKYKDYEVPFYTHGWEELFVRSNNMEKAIYFIEHVARTGESAKQRLRELYQSKIITVPFERFVINPWPYMEEIAQALGTKITAVTRRMMKKQNVPRRMYAEGIALKIYRRCGWRPPEKGSDERKELALRRQFVAENASKEAMERFDKLCAEYEKQYMGQ